MADKEFDGKVAIVTGASSGIGMATARALAREGAQVLSVGRSEEVLRFLVKEIGGTYVAIDLTSLEAEQVVINRSLSEWGRLDVLINAAGIIQSGSIETTSLEDFDRMVDINVRTVFRLMKAAVPHLKNTHGSIVNVSSVTGIRAFPNVLAYCVSKAAVDHLTRCTALELAPYGIRVNAVNPGVVVTNLHRRGGMDEKEYARFLEHSRTTHPLGRVGTPEEVAELILFLASEKANWITGETVSIDGGRFLTCLR